LLGIDVDALHYIIEPAFMLENAARFGKDISGKRK